MAWALAFGFVVAAASSLYCYYHYATPITPHEPTIVNPYGADTIQTNEVVQPLIHRAQYHYDAKPWSPPVHLAIGAGVCAVLQILTWQFSWWPLLPVGYIVATSVFAGQLWFSILLGWLAKLILLKLGGSSLYRQSRPVFIGLICGEALAAGTWMAINFALALSGTEYWPLRILPG